MNSARSTKKNTEEYRSEQQEKIMAKAICTPGANINECFLHPSPIRSGCYLYPGIYCIYNSIPLKGLDIKWISNKLSRETQNYLYGKMLKKIRYFFSVYHDNKMYCGVNSG